jgi:ribonuclease-3
LKDVLLPKADSFIENDLLKDPKSLLQESIQAKRLGSLSYEVIKEEGPAHAKIFTVGAYVNKNIIGSGMGRSKQIAQENAAIQALEKISQK